MSPSGIEPATFPLVAQRLNELRNRMKRSSLGQLFFRITKEETAMSFPIVRVYCVGIKEQRIEMLTCVETSTWCSVEAEAAPLGPRFPVDPPKDPATGRETVISLIARQSATSQSKYTLRYW